MPLTMRQMSGQNLNSRYTHVGIPTITITSVVLDFLGYEGLPLVKQQNFENFLIMWRFHTSRQNMMIQMQMNM